MQAYEQHFGFREPPFSLTPDPQFFYASPGYREAYSTLRYGVEARKGFVLVSGEAGTGKTTLLRMLMQQAPSSVHTAFIFNPPGRFTELLRVIMNELELPELSNDRVTMTGQFNDYLLDRLKQGHIVSILVDEAQTLSHEMLEELRLLSNLETNKVKLIQMVLMGQPELEQKLDKPELRQLKQRVALRCRLSPLRPEDIAPYINFRLAVAGYEGSELFDRVSVKKIALYAYGIPRLINVLCDNALLRAYHNAAGKVSVEMIDEAARDLRLNELQAPAPNMADSEVSTTGCNVAGAASLKRSVSMDFDRRTGRSNKLTAPFRAGLDAMVLRVGLWVALVISAATSAVLYVQHNRLLLTPVAGDAEEHVGPRRNHAGQMETLVSAPSVDPVADKGARIEAPSLETHDSFTGDFTQDSGTSETDQRSENEQSRAATPNNADMKRKPTDDTRSHQREKSSTKGVVRLNQEKAARAAVHINGQHSLGVFKVVGSSFVREKPSADAEITGALEPGTRIRVVSKTGKYLRVRALDTQRIGGYVHIEDAFFQPLGSRYPKSAANR